MNRGADILVRGLQELLLLQPGDWKIALNRRLGSLRDTNEEWLSCS